MADIRGNRILSPEEGVVVSGFGTADAAFGVTGFTRATDFSFFGGSGADVEVEIRLL